MGYTTTFKGKFTFNKNLDASLITSINDLCGYKPRPAGCPRSWCQWITDGNSLHWDEGEKFYDYVPWLMYIVGNILGPNGYLVNGEVQWSGEDMDDIGIITIVDNHIVAQSFDQLRQHYENTILDLIRCLDRAVVLTSDNFLIRKLAKQSYKKDEESG